MSSRLPIRYCSDCGNGLVEKDIFGKIRPFCNNCQKPIFLDPKVAAAVVVMQDGALLLVQRKNPPHKGSWTLPAGFVDAGEDPRRAAERECLEETGLNVKVTDLFDAYFGRDHDRGADIVLFFNATLISGKLIAGDDAAAADWFVIGEYPSLAFPSTHAVIKKLG